MNRDDWAGTPDLADRPYEYNGIFDDIDYVEAIDISDATFFIAPAMARACGCAPTAVFTTECCWAAETARIRRQDAARDRAQERRAS